MSTSSVDIDSAIRAAIELIKRERDTILAHSLSVEEKQDVIRRTGLAITSLENLLVEGDLQPTA